MSYGIRNDIPTKATIHFILFYEMKYGSDVETLAPANNSGREPVFIPAGSRDNQSLLGHALDSHQSAIVRSCGCHSVCVPA